MSAMWLNISICNSWLLECLAIDHTEKTDQFTEGRE